MSEVESSCPYRERFKRTDGTGPDGTPIVWVEVIEGSDPLRLKVFCNSEWWVDHWFKESESYPHFLRFTLAEFCTLFSPYTVPPEDLKLLDFSTVGRAYVFLVETPHDS